MLARTIAIALAVSLTGMLVAQSAFAGTTRYNPRRSGHPLRVIAYALHPIGVIVDTLIFHPAWWLGTHEPLRTLFGVEIVVDDSAEVARQVAARQHAEPTVDSPDLVEPDTDPVPVPD